MKSYVKRFVIGTLCMFAMGAFSACGDMFQVHVHFYNATPIQATCTEKGYTTYTCECGDTYMDNETPALGHKEDTLRGMPATCTQDGMSDGKYCAVCNETLVEQEIVKATGHNYINKECAKCGDKITDSVGLEYTQNSDGTYAVTGIGTCTDTNVVISATYNGKDVTSIGERAFYNCSSLTEIVIPDSVTSIGGMAFYGCDSLTEIVIPDSVTSIGVLAFYGCDSLTEISVDENNANYKAIDGNLYSKDGKALIQYSIGKTATSFTIPDSVTSISSWAFDNCSSLTEIVIPESVTNICSSAFLNCSSLTSIIFKDTSTWYRTKNYDNWQNQTGGTQTDVTSASTNANNFKSNYDNYFWYKK